MLPWTRKRLANLLLPVVGQFRRYFNAFLVRSPFAVSLSGTHLSSGTTLSSLSNLHGLGQPCNSPLAYILASESLELNSFGIIFHVQSLTKALILHQLAVCLFNRNYVRTSIFPSWQGGISKVPDLTDAKHEGGTVTRVEALWWYFMVQPIRLVNIHIATVSSLDKSTSICNRYLHIICLPHYCYRMGGLL